MRLGLIAGTVFYGQDIFADARREEMDTPFGRALLLVNDRAVYVARHGLEPDHYILPHEINHRANLHALKAMGVSEVLSVNSTGSLSRSIGPGSIVVPDDFISLFQVITVAHHAPLHVTPALSLKMRRRILEAATAADVPVMDGGVYWQSPGPRLETRAEVNLIRHFATVVGMTMGSEACLAVELGLEYAGLCSVDNYAHGLDKPPVTEEQIREGARANSQRILAVVKKLLGY